MDEGQNNANKANGDSAAGSQGIFSTPELTVDTIKIAQTNSNNDKSRIASIFANTDAGQRSQKLNNVMGVSSQPITEDLVIQNEPKKRSKAPIILAVLVLIAVISGLVGWFIINNLPQIPQESAVSVEDAKKKFDQYATYLLYGKSEDELSGKYDVEGFYELDDVFYDDEPNEDYWNKSIKLLQESIDSYNTTKEPKENIKTSQKNSLAMLEMLKVYSVLDLPTDSQILEQYLKTDSQGVQTFVTLSLGDLQKQDSERAKILFEARQKQYQDFINVLDIYNENGCVVDGALDGNCVANLPEESLNQISELNTSRAQAKNTADSLIDNSVKQLETSCWQISSQFLANGTEETKDEN